MIREVIVVEGRDDTVAIKRAVEADTIETGGSALNEMTFKRIALAQERRGVIIFTDPDFAGERIRKAVAQRVPGCKHAFITKKEALAKGDIGVENASPEAIRHALANVRSEMPSPDGQPLTWNDLMDAGLAAHTGSSERRMKLGEILGIGYCNAKQFLKRCTAFQISREEFEQALRELNMQHTPNEDD
ncbi:MAG: ribonuclease M5 [Paenibacillus sp.]|uniref:Ribonuclease M5 n=1 Tax=Paenibacillus aquistagni TaxID=1852522 RepID=A0A1X7M002_9BACL|nr:ribonuclease M5 [Paenibacillus aquistagni]MBR2567995.1 ribonuclease M5 [Paenibacillus sp.]NMM55266.1 ribonuclease M5 [Paenibacillus aquistagni]SMG58863.1 RNAse M5 [Paenibacillus aquistagni]